MNIKKVLPSIIFLLWFDLQAQEIPQIIPPSPEAASLGKYADIPVGLYTGTPSISIPLWTINSKEVSLPISLGYHAGGIKVEENASRIGLGWSLNAGGVITRTVRGIEDDGAGGYMNSPPLPSNPTMLNLLDDVVGGDTDSEPDLFFFNFNGYTGKFVYSKDANKFVLISDSDIDIDYDTNGTIIIAFIITTEDGTVYRFDTTEVTKANTLSWKDGVLVIDKLSISTTAWYLKTITSPSVKGADTITFTYENEKYQYRGPKTGKNGYRIDGDLEIETQTQTTYEIDGLRLSFIDAPSANTTVIFEPGEIREDVKQISGGDEARKLSTIKIKNSLTSEVVRIFKLDNAGYFTNNKISSAPADEKYLYRRLRLDGVQELDKDLNLFKNPYIFTYDETELPPKDAHTQDHWGYYNGAFFGNNFYSNNFMIPPYKGRVNNVEDQLVIYCNEDAANPQIYPLNILDYVEVNGDNREPDYPAMQAGILTSIQYPTGGKATFEYEPHEYSFVGSKDYQIVEHRTDDFMAEIGKYDVYPDNPVVVQSTTFTPALVNGKNQVIPIYYELEQIYASVDQREEPLPGDEMVTKNEILLREVASGKIIFQLYVDYDGSYEVYQKHYDKENDSDIISLIEYDEVQTAYDAAQEIYLMTAMYRSSIQDPTLVELEANTEYVLEAKRYLDNDIDFANYTINNETQILISMDGIQLIGGENIITNHTAGGLRIKKQIVDSNNTSPSIVTNYFYKIYDENGNETQQSSGSLLALPGHFYSRYYEDLSGGGVSTGSGLLEGCYQQQRYVYTVLEANAGYNIPLSTTQGNHIGYDQVKVQQTGNGYTIHNFHSPRDFGDQLPSSIYQAFDDEQIWEYEYTKEIQEYLTPFVATISQDWKRGLLHIKSDYDESGVNRRKEENNYTLNNQSKAEGVAVHFNDQYSVLSTINRWAEYTKYSIIGGFTQLSAKTVSIYNEDGINAFTTTTNYDYNTNKHFQVAKTTTTTSENKTLVNEFKYAEDLASNQYGSDLLKTRNMRSQVIEQLTKVNNVLTSRVINHYKLDNNLVLLDFIENYPSGTGESITISFEYDGQGNITQTQKDKDAPTTYYWRHNKTLPVAQAVNASDGQIFHNSFEETGVDPVGPRAKTGKKVLNTGSYDSEFPIPQGDTREYILSFWYWDDRTGEKKWKYHETKYTGPKRYDSPNSGNQIDEVRIFPKGALMTTYTYDPLIGITSVCDPNNTVTYYQYDDLGRLEVIKDNQHHLLQKHEYHYRTQ